MPSQIGNGGEIQSYSEANGFGVRLVLDCVDICISYENMGCLLFVTTSVPASFESKSAFREQFYDIRRPVLSLSAFLRDCSSTDMPKAHFRELHRRVCKENIDQFRRHLDIVGQYLLEFLKNAERIRDPAATLYEHLVNENQA